MKRRHVLLRPDLVEHPQHRLVGAAVERAVERRDPGRDGGERVDVRRPDPADGARRAVLLVVGVEDEQDLERPLQDGVRLVPPADLERHVDEVADVVQVVARQDVREAVRVPEDVGGDGRQLRHQANALEVAPVRIVDVLGVRVEGRQGADRSEQHPHRVRVVPEALEELLDVRVDVRVVPDVLLPPVQLLGVRQLAFEQEECRLEERRLLRELLDRVPPVAQDPRVAVDVRDRAAAGRRVEVRRVVGHQPGVVVLGADLLEVRRPDRAVGDGQRVLVPGAVVGDRQRVLRHRSSPFLESTAGSFQIEASPRRAPSVQRRDARSE